MRNVNFALFVSFEMLNFMEIQQFERINVIMTKVFTMIKLAILASGNGSNAQRIIEYFASHRDVQVECVVYNVKNAFVAERANNLGVTAQYFGRKDFYESGAVCRYLKGRGVDWVILAGFLWLVPGDILSAFHHKVINIHPALLPKYGGKGMYGIHVHEAVIANAEKQSGITIHIVDEEYDKGKILCQATCDVAAVDTPESLADKVHELEYEYFPKVIENTVLECE